MLKQLRQKRVMKRVLWVLALIIIPAFVLWGAGGLRESRDCAGIVFGKKVPFDIYRASLNAVKNQALITYGSGFYKIQDKLNLEGQAWDHLIMLKEAKDKKIKVSNEEVIARIASFGFFQNKDGNFDQRAYKLILNNAFRTDPRNFEEEMRQSIMVEKLLREAIKDVPEPTDDEIEEAMKKEAEKKDKEEEKVEKAKKVEKKKEEKREEGKEETKEETEEQKRERIKTTLIIQKRIEVYQKWRDGLHKRANLISNIPKEEKEVQEGPQEEVKKEAKEEKEE